MSSGGSGFGRPRSCLPRRPPHGKQPMTTIGWHASHEQIAPSALLAAACLAAEASTYVRPEDVTGSVGVSSDPVRHVEWLHEMVDLGFDGIWIHDVGQVQRPVLETSGEHVLPRVRDAQGGTT